MEEFKTSLETRIILVVEIDSKDFSEIQAQWATVRGRIRQKIGDAQFKSWIKIISLKDCVDGKIILSVPSAFVLSLIHI